MEPLVPEEDVPDEQSLSKHSQAKSRRIKKSPKPDKLALETPIQEKRESIFSSLRVVPQFGIFQSEMQKQSRLQKFWLLEIDNYYREQIGRSEKQMLESIIEQEIPSLQDVLRHCQQVLPTQRLPFEELFRYVQLVRECRLGSQLMLVENQDKKFLAVFDGDGELARLAEVSQQEAFLLEQRQKFMAQLRDRQQRYNKSRNENQRLSQISSEVAFLLYLMHQNKNRINVKLTAIQRKIQDQPVIDSNSSQKMKDEYISYLINKNLRRALVNEDIDFYNYFANLDAIEQYGVIDGDQKLISDKKEFQEYMKKKKGKKSRKNVKGVLKTSCGGCLSPHHEQYNPFLYCPDCHTRFHKYCYTPFKDNLCESCFHKKEPVFKSRPVQCQFCSNRGLLAAPLKSVKEGVSIHVFCMFINGLWKFQNGALEFKSNSFVGQTPSNNEPCSICNSTVYTYPCRICNIKAHPLCAYLAGWNIQIVDEGGLILQCCCGVDLQKNSYRRKFMLNYKKFLYKEHKQR